MQILSTGYRLDRGLDRARRTVGSIQRQAASKQIVCRPGSFLESVKTFGQEAQVGWEVSLDSITDVFKTLKVAAVVHSRLEATAPWGLTRPRVKRKSSGRIPLARRFVILRTLTEVWQTLRMVERERSRRKAASEEIRCELASGGSGGIWQTR